MTQAFGGLVKQGLLAAGHYRRALARTVFPGVAVLCYHGVRDDSMAFGTIPLEYLHIPASTLESHCRVIRECCDPISLDDWRDAWNGRARLPKRPVLMTFDDGYRSVLNLGIPILQKYQLPAAVFVCTAPMSTRRMLWFDHVAARDGEDAVERWKAEPHDAWCESCARTQEVADADPRALLKPDELRALAKMKGIEIGGHSARHSILARASASQQRQEIEQNLQAIRDWTGTRVRAFAYPNGRPDVDYNGDTVAILANAGIDVAFTTRPSFARADELSLERSRFMILDGIGAAELAHRLTYSWPR